MVLRASRRCTVRKNERLVLAIIDMTWGVIDHIVLYEGAEGQLQAVLGSFDQGPFGTDVEAVRWMVRTLHASGSAPPS